MLERLFQHRLRTLDRAYDPYPRRRLRAEIERYEFGAVGQLPAFRLKLLRNARPMPLLLLYPVLAIAAVVAALIIG